MGKNPNKYNDIDIPNKLSLILSGIDSTLLKKNNVNKKDMTNITNVKTIPKIELYFDSLRTVSTYSSEDLIAKYNNNIIDIVYKTIKYGP